MASKQTPDTAIDVAALTVVDEPYTDGRALQKTKYDAFFETVQPNKRIVCPPGKAGGLACSYRKWLQKRGHEDVVVKSRERCDDEQGGVWWIKEVAKPKTVWQSLERKAA